MTHGLHFSTFQVGSSFQSITAKGFKSGRGQEGRMEEKGRGGEGRDRTWSHSFLL